MPFINSKPIYYVKPSDSQSGLVKYNMMEERRGLECIYAFSVASAESSYNPHGDLRYLFDRFKKK